jgi:hypothetical protein
MDIVIVGLLLISIGLILKMVLESKKQIDGLVEELEDIQHKIERSITKNKKRNEQKLMDKYSQNTVLANGDLDFTNELSTTPYTIADHN